MAFERFESTSIWLLIQIKEIQQNLFIPHQHFSSDTFPEKKLGFRFSSHKHIVFIDSIICHLQQLKIIIKTIEMCWNLNQRQDICAFVCMF